MHASTGSRKRTRSQWAKHYEELHNEIKAKKVSGPATVGGDKGVKNLVDCESAIEDDSVASMDRSVMRGNKKFDLGEEVVSNDLGLGSIVGNSKDSSHVLAISSDDSADPGNSRANSDGSDAKDDDLSNDAEDDGLSGDAEDDGLSDDDDEDDDISDNGKDDEFSDRDYEADEQLTSDDSQDSYEDERETEDENDGALYEKKEINNKRKVDDESDEDCDGDEKDKFPSVFESTRIRGMKGIYADLESTEGGCETHDSAGHNKTIADQEEEDLLIISKDEFIGNCSNATVDMKQEDKLTGLGRFHEPCSNKGWVKANKVGDSTDLWRIVKESKVEDSTDLGRTVKENKVGDSTDSWRVVKENKVGESTDLWRIVKESKEVNVNVNESSLKGRQVLGLGKAEESDCKEDKNLASTLRPCTASKLRNALGVENAEESNCKEGTNLSNLHRPCAAFKLPRNEPKPEKISSHFSNFFEFDPYKSHKSKSLGDSNSSQIEREQQSCQDYLKKLMNLGKKNTRAKRNNDLTKILVDSINSLKEKQCPIQENNLIQGALPLRFRFEDELQPPIEKSEWEKEMDSLFCDLEFGHRESELDSTSICLAESYEHDSIEIDHSQAALCRRGEHEGILDEEIGIKCKYCGTIILDIKYVLPDFHIPSSSGRRNKMNFDESPNSVRRPILLQEPAIGNPGSGCGSYNCVQGTVWDLIPGVEKEMYPHQREGFEFLWRNLAGDIRFEKLKQPLSGGGSGCIISHAPGTGKTRLTIMFLQTFLKLYPTCRPVIIAPRGMLLTWEAEFVKWHVDVPFHNLNKLELSRDESAVAAQFMGQVGSGEMSRDHIRLVKLYSWMKGNSILGLSYQLFEKLSGETEEGQKQQIRNMLLDFPGLLVLDEGHTPRNNQSQLWNALMEVATHRRIILSGTPFQNNLAELHNTLCLVNPQFVSQIGSEYDTSYFETQGRKSNMSGKKRAKMINSTGKNRVRLTELKRMLDPFIHVYKGNILEEKLSGLSECLLFLRPTELQKTLLETAIKVDIFHRIQLVSFISVHPALMLKMGRFVSIPMAELEEVESDVDAGVKMKFVMQLIWLADAIGERVLIFSQYIDPLVFIKKHIMSRFSWTEGREVLYMDGKLDEKQRQESILSFNDDKSSAKVLLASERACSEGISLVGASRVVLLDTVWNPAVEKQAISRAYRLGQKKVVYVYRLFTSGMEVKQFAQQIRKQRISQMIVPPTDGDTSQNKKSSAVPDDKVLEAMVCLDTSGDTFEKIIRQPKESDLIEIYGLMDQHK